MRISGHWRRATVSVSHWGKSVRWMLREPGRGRGLTKRVAASRSGIKECFLELKLFDGDFQYGYFISPRG